MASERSVRRVWVMVGKRVERVMPTMPQPAPSSMTFRFGFDRVLFSSGNCGSDLGDGPPEGDIDAR